MAASVKRGVGSGVTMVKDPAFAFEILRYFLVITAIICATGLAVAMVFG